MHTALEVVEVGGDALGIGLIEARLDDAGAFRERAQVGALIPGAAGGASDRGDDGHIGVFADAVANFGDQRGDRGRAEIQIGAQIRIALQIGLPEGAGHIVGNVDVAIEVVGNLPRHAALES
ncbi:hypothetical protein D9M68_869360 [compost metagenome]